MAGCLCVAEDSGERLAQFVRERTGEFADRRDPAQMRQLTSLGGCLELGALAIGDVPDDAEDLVAVTADDARLVEALAVVVGPHGVFDLLGFVRRAYPYKGLRQRLSDWRRQYLGDPPAKKC